MEIMIEPVHFNEADNHVGFYELFILRILVRKRKLSIYNLFQLKESELSSSIYTYVLRTSLVVHKL